MDVVHLQADPCGRTFVLVPSYNHASYVEQCLRSIFDQTTRPLKLLVIDDGSSDNSAAMIERVLNDCPFESELIARENRGLCRTLNEGLEHSSGEYFAYLGSDDYWLSGFLSARERLLDDAPDAVLAFGNCSIVDDNGEVIESTADNRETQDWYRRGDPLEMLLSGMAPASPTVVYRRSALSRQPWNVDAKLEDYDLYLHLSKQGAFGFDPEVLSAWRVHGTNTSKNRSLMLSEILAAQMRRAGELDLTEGQVEAARSATTFRYARIALQAGDREEAVSLARDSWRSASWRVLLRFVLRVFLPSSFVRYLRGPVPRS